MMTNSVGMSEADRASNRVVNDFQFDVPVFTGVSKGFKKDEDVPLFIDIIERKPDSDEEVWADNFHVTERIKY